MDSVGGLAQTGALTVKTTQNTGLSVEYWADRCLDRIIFVGDKTHRVVRDQAQAYKDDIRKILIIYMGKAIQSDRTTLYNLFAQQEQGDMAEILRKL